MTQEPDPGQFPLEAKRIVAGYGGQSVLRDVFLSVPAKSLTVLVGPNGSGKSTLLALLSRLLKPSDGSVLLDGRAELHLFKKYWAQARADTFAPPDYMLRLRETKLR